MIDTATKNWDLDSVKADLLTASLPHIAFDGWSVAAFERGATGANLSSTDFIRAFPSGVAEAFEWFNADCDRRMEEQLAGMELETMRIRDRIAAAVRCRLEMNTEHREAVRRGITWAAQPQYTPLGLKCLYRTVDKIWYAVGDKATDYNYYTKRLLLAGVVTTTTIRWLDDNSEGAEDSWAFLDRRIADVMKIPRAIGRLKTAVTRLPGPQAIFRCFTRH